MSDTVDDAYTFTSKVREARVTQDLWSQQLLIIQTQFEKPYQIALSVEKIAEREYQRHGTKKPARRYIDEEAWTDLRAIRAAEGKGRAYVPHSFDNEHLSYAMAAAAGVDEDEPETVAFRELPKQVRDLLNTPHSTSPVQFLANAQDAVLDIQGLLRDAFDVAEAHIERARADERRALATESKKVIVDEFKKVYRGQELPPSLEYLIHKDTVILYVNLHGVVTVRDGKFASGGSTAEDELAGLALQPIVFAPPGMRVTVLKDALCGLQGLTTMEATTNTERILRFPEDQEIKDSDMQFIADVMHARYLPLPDISTFAGEHERKVIRNPKLRYDSGVLERHPSTVPFLDKTIGRSDDDVTQFGMKITVRNGPPGSECEDLYPLLSGVASKLPSGYFYLRDIFNFFALLNVRHLVIVDTTCSIVRDMACTTSDWHDPDGPLVGRISSIVPGGRAEIRTRLRLRRRLRHRRPSHQGLQL